MKKTAFLLAVALSLFSIISCQTTGNPDVPYIVLEPNVELGDDGVSYSFAGTRFTLYNDSKKDISSFSVSFMLYDSEGNNPFIGSNCITEDFYEVIPAESRGEFVVSLDSYLTQIPNEPYKLDFFYVKRISYADGSSWSDPFGLYAVSEARAADE